MGMTIDEALETIKGERWISCQEKYLEAMNLITETMRKYQKIEQIVNSNPDYIHHTDMDTYKLNSIREVIENGGND